VLEIIDDNNEIILDEDGVPPYLEFDLYWEVRTTPISKRKTITSLKPTFNEVGTIFINSSSNDVQEKHNHLIILLMHMILNLVHILSIFIFYLFWEFNSFHYHYSIWFIDPFPFPFKIFSHMNHLLWFAFISTYILIMQSCLIVVIIWILFVLLCLP